MAPDSKCTAVGFERGTSDFREVPDAQPLGNACSSDGQKEGGWTSEAPLKMGASTVIRAFSCTLKSQPRSENGHHGKDSPLGIEKVDRWENR